MNFNESVNYLLSLGNEVSAMKLGLENIRALLKHLNDPQKNFIKVQVAGTNGKGSTCVFLDSICRAANIKTGLYTSPHLISITERIKISGVEISEEDFARHATTVRETAEKLFDEKELEYIPTFFEQVTAIALVAFAEAKIKLAILETGLGGRLDATTAANAGIAAITPIDYDHQQYLGDTIEEIAAEKAAIIHKDSKVVIAPQKPEAGQIIRRRCDELKIIPVFSGNTIPSGIQMKMRGRHQEINAALASGIVETLNRSGFSINEESIKTGLETAEHPGRLEYIEGILFDGAHNIAGAKALAEYLDEFVKKPVALIFGAMNDKDLSQIAEILFSKAAYLILTPVNNSRTAATEDLLKLVPESFPKDNIFPAKNSSEALEIAQKIAVEAGETIQICVTGSLYLAGEMQQILKEQR